MIYLVDTENIPLAWVQYLKAATPEDEFILFYGTKSLVSLNYIFVQTLLESSAKVRCVPCYAGANAMDFQLCTELGFCIAQNRTAKYAIVSKDAGYDPVVKHWLDQGVFVERLAPQNISLSETYPLAPDNAQTVLTSQMPKPKLPTPKAEDAKKIEPVKPTEEIMYNGKPISAHFLKKLQDGKTGLPMPALQSISQMMERSMHEPEGKRLEYVKTQMSQKFKGLTGKYYRAVELVLHFALFGQNENQLSEEYLKLLHTANSGLSEGILKDVAKIMTEGQALPRAKRLHFIYTEIFRKYKKPGQRCYQKLRPTIAKAMAA